jgi:hypothetical protein
VILVYDDGIGQKSEIGRFRALTQSSERQDCVKETRDKIQVTSETGDLIKLEFFPSKQEQVGPG